MNTAIWTWKILAFSKKFDPFFFQAPNTEHWMQNTRIRDFQHLLQSELDCVQVFFIFWTREHEQSHLNLENLSLFPKNWTFSFFKLPTLNTERKILDLEIFSTCSNLNWIAFSFFSSWLHEHEHSHLNLENLSLFPKKWTPSFFKLWTLNAKY